MDFGHTINRLRSLDGDVRAWVPRGGGAKRSNRAWTEQPQVVQFTHFNDIVKSSDINLQFGIIIMV